MQDIRPPPKGADPRILDAPARGITGAALLRILLVGGLAAAPVASRPLAQWSDHLPDALAPVQAALHRWDALMEAARLTTPYDAIHQAFRRLTDTG